MLSVAFFVIIAFFFFKQKTAYEMRISDWSSDVCSSDLITFTDEADAKLKPVVRDVEREVTREIAKIRIEQQAAAVWRQSFATLELNRANPPVWIRVTPPRILSGGYRLAAARLSLALAPSAVTDSLDRKSAL